MTIEEAKQLGYSVLYFSERQDWHEDGWVAYRGDDHVYFPPDEDDIYGGAHVFTSEEDAWADLLEYLDKNKGAI